MIESPGVYKIPSEDYHKDTFCSEPCLSRSTIKDLIFECPGIAWWNHPRLNPAYKPDYGDGKFDIGTASHALLLEGIDNTVIVEAEDWKKKENQEIRKEAWKQGKVPLLRKYYERTKSMVEIAEQQIISCEDFQKSGITNFRTDGDSEVTYIWEEDGVWMKIRLDWISKDHSLILDYKTTGTTVNPFDIGKQIGNMNYDIQDAFYRRGVKAIDGIDPKFIFMFQNENEPHFASFIELSEEDKIVGEQKVWNGIELWRTCMNTGKWPSYPNKVITVHVPRYNITNWEQRSPTIGADIE